MDQKERVLFDASAYMLFEASGDSDQAGEYSDNGALDQVKYSDAVAAAVDDAQSCSYGYLSTDSARKHHEVIDDDFDGDDFEDYEAVVEEDSGSSEEEEDGVVDQCRGGGKEINLKKLSKVCEESMNVKLMNDGERDKLFWEACLAL